MKQLSFILYCAFFGWIMVQGYNYRQAEDSVERPQRHQHQVTPTSMAPRPITSSSTTAADLDQSTDTEMVLMGLAILFAGWQLGRVKLRK